MKLKTTIAGAECYIERTDAECEALLARYNKKLTLYRRYFTLFLKHAELGDTEEWCRYETLYKRHGDFCEENRHLIEQIKAKP